MTGPRASVTVAICTFNRASYLRQTLAGIVRQSYPADRFEILVIDNNSTDDTAAVVGEFASARPAPRRILEPRQGLDWARNRAIDEAQGVLILFGDDDILVAPDWVGRMAAPFATDPGHRIGAAGGEVIPVFPDGLPPWVAAWHGPLAFRKESGPVGAGQSPMGANLAVPKETFRAVGKFHTALDRTAGSFFSGGDSELIRRVRAAGLEVWFIPEGAVRHQMPASRTTFGYARRHAFDSARSRVIDRAALPGAAPYLLSRIPANAAKALFLTVAALACALILRTGDAKKALVRAWRCCGYLYQIPRSLRGKT